MRNKGDVRSGSPSNDSGKTLTSGDLTPTKGSNTPGTDNGRRLVAMMQHAADSRHEATQRWVWEVRRRLMAGTEDFHNTARRLEEAKRSKAIDATIAKIEEFGEKHPDKISKETIHPMIDKLLDEYPDALPEFKRRSRERVLED